MNTRKTILALLVSVAVPAFAQQPSQLDQELEMLRAYCMKSGSIPPLTVTPPGYPLKAGQS